MKKLIRRSLALSLILFSSFSQASLFWEVSQNSSASPGAKVYLPSPAPDQDNVPFLNPATTSGVIPLPQTTFLSTDDIRVASMYATEFVDASMLAYGDPNKLDWEYSFVSMANPAIVVSGTVTKYTLNDALNMLLAGELFTFWSDDSLLQSGLLSAGTWTANTRLEGEFMSSVDFTIPGSNPPPPPPNPNPVSEPGTLALLALGFLAVGAGRRRAGK